jgi:hypothetical protein
VWVGNRDGMWKVKLERRGDEGRQRLYTRVPKAS